MDDFTHRGRRGRIATLTLWVLLTCCVITGSLLPINSPVMAAVWRLHVSDKALHFCAYMALSVLLLPDVANRRNGRLGSLDDGTWVPFSRLLSVFHPVAWGTWRYDCQWRRCFVRSALGIPFRGWSRRSRVCLTALHLSVAVHLGGPEVPHESRVMLGPCGEIAR